MAPAPAYGPPPGATLETPPTAIIALVAGIVSYVFCFGLGGLVALICGFMARKQIKAEPNRYGGAGMAMAGLVLGGINLALAVIGTILYIIFAVILVAAS